MRLSTRSRYGTRAMLELARLSGSRPVSLETLGENQGIPLRYLAKIVQDLRRAGLVKSVRGAHGGYLLGRAPSKISVADIVGALQGNTALVECVEDPRSCERSPQCVTRRVWSQVTQAMMDVMGSFTLGGMLNGQPAAGSVRVVETRGTERLGENS